jgi:hypothetical protein
MILNEKIAFGRRAPRMYALQYICAKIGSDHLRVARTECSKNMRGTNYVELFPTFMLAKLRFALFYDKVSRSSETNHHQQSNI